jgi:homoserine kinase type II
MAVYTHIDDEALEAFLKDYDLGEATAFKGIAEGVSNSNYLLETEKGRFILTVYEARAAAEDLPYFLGLMRWLADAGFPSAAPVPGRDGQALRSICGKPAAISTFLPGVSANRPDVGLCREAGRGLAWLHEAAADYPRTRDNDFGHQHWDAMFEPLAGAAEHLKPGLADTIRGDLKLFADNWPAGLTHGTVHADYFPDNVFFQNHRFAAAIDFYFACTDALAYDVAVSLNAWCFETEGSFNVTKAQAFLAGYEDRRPLSDIERSAMPLLAHGAAMRFFLTRLADHANPPKDAIIRPKDPLEYERKLAVHRAGVGLFGFS